MIYFSELKGKSVNTEDNIKIGVLEDLIFLASEKPNITKIVIRNFKNEKVKIPIEFLKKINNIIIIAKDYQNIELKENELHLEKNILDKQIIDLQDNKIVRVNDVLLQEKNGFYIVGVDTGLMGIARWFKLESYLVKINRILHLKVPTTLLSWVDIQPLELTRGQVKLRKEEKRLEKLHPEDLADYLEKTNIANIKKILNMLDEKFAAEVIGHLNINFQTSLFRQFTPEKAAKVLELVDSDEATDILLTLSSKKKEIIIELIPQQKKAEILRLINLSSTSIGEYLTTEILTVRSSDTAAEVIEKIKKQATDFPVLVTIYVVNEQNQLIGLFGLHELLIQKPDLPVYKFMIQNIVVVHLSTPKEIALNKMIKYRFSTLPVIDNDKHMLGMITMDDIAKAVIKL